MENLRYELWEFGWDGFFKTFRILILLTLFFAGLFLWKQSYPLRRSMVESKYDSQILGHISKIEERKTIRETLRGNYYITLGWKIEYGFMLNDSAFVREIFIPKPRNKEMRDFVKHVNYNWQRGKFQILYDSKNPADNTLKILGTGFKSEALESLIHWF